MEYRFLPGETVAGAFARTISEQARSAVDAVRGAADHPDDATAIHDARKRTKKIRAVLRLSRPALGRAEWEKRNAAVRDAARLLSSSRDAEVLARVASDVAVAAPEARAVADALAARRAGVGGREGAAAGEFAERLERDLGWLATPPSGIARHTVRAGLERVWRSARRRMAAAADRPTGDALHDWRKRVKDLWYHHRLLDRLWPPVMEAWAHELHLLSEHLGDEHDLAVLEGWLDDRAPGEIPPAAFDAAVVEITARRRTLREQAFALGGVMLAEPARAAGERIERWWVASDAG